MTRVREKISSDTLYHFKGRTFPLRFCLVAQVLEVAHLGLCIARHIDKPIHAFASAEALEHVSVQSGSGWVNYPHNFLSILSACLLQGEWRENSLSSACVKLDFRPIKDSFVQCHVLLRVLYSLLNKFDSDYLLRLFGQTEPNRSRATTHVKEDCVVVDLCKLGDQGQHFLEDKSVYLEESEG